MHSDESSAAWPQKRRYGGEDRGDIRFSTTVIVFLRSDNAMMRWTPQRTANEIRGHTQSYEQA